MANLLMWGQGKYFDDLKVIRACPLCSESTRCLPTHKNPHPPIPFTHPVGVGFFPLSPRRKNRGAKGCRGASPSLSAAHAPQKFLRRAGYWKPTSRGDRRLQNPPL